jgi:hypothetical protein
MESNLSTKKYETMRINSCQHSGSGWYSLADMMACTSLHIAAIVTTQLSPRTNNNNNNNTGRRATAAGGNFRRRLWQHVGAAAGGVEKLPDPRVRGGLL